MMAYSNVITLTPVQLDFQIPRNILIHIEVIKFTCAFTLNNINLYFPQAFEENVLFNI